MAGAGFFSIHAAKLKFGSDGRWYADDEPVTHARLARFFTRHLRRSASEGYEIWVDERYHAGVEIEDTAYVVTAVSGDLSADTGASLTDGCRGFIIRLNDDTTEPLAADTLEVGTANVLYCCVKGGTERARFLRPAYYDLAQFIEETAGGRFQLRCGTATYTIAQL